MEELALVFDSYVALSLMALGLALYISAFLIYRGRNDLKNLILGFIVVVLAFNLYHDFLVHSRLLLKYSGVWGFGGVLNPFIFSLTYLFFLQATKGINRKDLLHLLIPTLYFIYRLVHRIYGEYDIEALITYYQTEPGPEVEFDGVWVLNFLVHFVYPLVYLLLIAKLYRGKALARQSKWHKSIIFFALIEFGLMTILYCKLIFHLDINEWISAILSTMAQILFLGILIIRYPVDPSKTFAKGGRYSSSKLSVATANDFILKMEKAIIEQSLYKMPELSLKDLANIVGTNQRYLSQCINGKLNMSFTNYINKFRVDLSKELLLNPEYDKYTIEAIAQEVGFNSKSSYYRAFKKITDQTPSQFKKQSLEK